MKRLFGFLAVAGLMTLAAPADRAQAVTLLNPAAAAQTRHLSESLVVEVRHRGGFRGFHGGGRHFGHRHFGHRHVHFHRGHFHHRHFQRHRHFHRPHFAHRHIWRPRPIFVYTPRYCRWVYTDFGPRRICRHRPWWA